MNRALFAYATQFILLIATTVFATLSGEWQAVLMFTVAVGFNGYLFWLNPAAPREDKELRELKERLNVLEGQLGTLRAKLGLKLGA